MADVTIMGRTWCSRSYMLRDFFYRQGMDAEWFDTDTQDASGLPDDMEYPIVALPDGRLLQNPSLEDLSEVVGYTTIPGSSVYDLVIVGAGPAGLSAAIYAGSEGLHTCLIDGFVPGGQAGSTSYIENLLGYPKGVSGCDFAADAVAHVLRFDKVDLIAPVSVTRIAPLPPVHKGFDVYLSTGTVIRSTTIIIATGVSYRYLDVPGAETFLNRGVYYGASLSEANRYTGKSIAIVGGGNSAGQAAMHFSLYCRKVRLIIRRDSLTETMSDYLIKKILTTPNIELVPNSELTRINGSDRVTGFQTRDRVTGKRRKLAAQGVFIFIGATPHTDWIENCVECSQDGYILTGGLGWRYSTSTLGIFAVGDVRHGSMKRVISAAGEGAGAVSEVHQYFARLKEVE